MAAPQQPTAAQGLQGQHNDFKQPCPPPHGAQSAPPSKPGTAPTCWSNRQCAGVGLVAILAVGAILTAAMHPLSTAKDSWGFLASVLGWAQLLLSAIALWPQVALNSRRQSAAGVSMDFVLLTTLSTLLAVVAAAGSSAASPAALQEMLPAADPITLSRALMALRCTATLAAFVLVWQVNVFPRGGQIPSRAARLAAVSMVCVVCGVLVAAAGGSAALPWPTALTITSTLHLLCGIVGLMSQISLSHVLGKAEAVSPLLPTAVLGSGVAGLCSHLVSSTATGDWGPLLSHPLGIIAACVGGALAAVLLVQGCLMYGTARPPPPGLRGRSSSRTEVSRLIKGATGPSPLSTGGVIAELELGDVAVLVDGAMPSLVMPAGGGGGAYPARPQSAASPRPRGGKLMPPRSPIIRPVPRVAPPASVASMDTEMGAALMASQM